jgi:hypothetical protein
LVHILQQQKKRLIMDNEKKNTPGDEQNSNNGLKGDNTIKDPDNWTTGDEPMTGAQRSYLQTLASEAGEEVNENLSKAEASKRINELQEKTGRGKES